MKLSKSILLACSLFAMSACGTNQGATLTVENASTYIEPLKEDVGNGNFDDKTISFHLYPNATAGKLFSDDIKGKCTVSFKYATGFFNWSEPVEVKDIAFVYKSGGTSSEGYKQTDYLYGSFANTVTDKMSMVNIYNVRVTEISGHMLP